MEALSESNARRGIGRLTTKRTENSRDPLIGHGRPPGLACDALAPFVGSAWPDSPASLVGAAPAPNNP
jgi:hypothetical protein